MSLQEEINPERALVFRITHRDNVPWIIEHGLHARRSGHLDPNFVSIGLTDLIERRHVQAVPGQPGRTLSDYIPFYFTPLSMMAFRIKTGWNVTQRSNGEIVILVTSLRRLAREGIEFLFTDRHASVASARFSNDLANLDRIDWEILQNKDFDRNNEDLGKTDRYQAEALVHSSLPVSALLAIACCDDDGKVGLEHLVQRRGLEAKVLRKRSWYF